MHNNNKQYRLKLIKRIKRHGWYPNEDRMEIWLTKPIEYIRVWLTNGCGCEWCLMSKTYSLRKRIASAQAQIKDYYEDDDSG